MITEELYAPILAFVLAFVITYISIPSIVKVSHLKHLFDEPDERKVHVDKTPSLGGIAIFAGLSVASLIFINHLPEIRFIIAASIILFFIGIKDDILIIAALTKLLGQIFAASVLVTFTDIHFTNLHGLFGFHEISAFAGIPLTIFTIIVITNSFNLIDGIDGLSSSLGIIISGTFGIWFWLSGHYQYTVLAVSLIGGLLAFMRFNLFGGKNKIFMGDTGSLILGFIISVLVIKFNELNITPNFKYAVYGAPTISFAILMIPLFDTMRVMFLRFFQRKPIFFPDKQHLHHMFLNLGFTHIQTDIILVSANVLFIIAAFYLHNEAGLHMLALIFLLAAMIIFHIPAQILEKRNKKNNTKKSVK